MHKSTGERFADISFYGLVLLLVYLVFRVFWPFLVPLGWAAVLAVMAYSGNKKLERRMGRTLAALVSTAGVTLILIVPVLLLTTLFVREGIDATRSVQASMASGGLGALDRSWEWLTARIAQYTTVDLAGLVRQDASRFGGYLASKLGGVVRDVFLFVFELFVTLFALFFFLRDSGSLVRFVHRILPFDEVMREKMLGEARELVFASVTTGLVIAAIQGAIGGAAFALVGLHSAVFWGMLMAFLALLPVVGTWPIWIPAVIWLFATGHAGRALALLGICGGVVTTIDNIVRPLLLGGRSSMNGLLVFISVLGGIQVFGVLGVILGPVVVATLIGMLDVYSRKETETRVPS